jgi:hypothetical protein
MTIYGRSARHDIHYQFCHVLLPGLALGGGDAAYLIGMLVVEEAPRYLAEFWNSIAGDDPDLRATEQDFAVQMECFTDGWIAFVITPPPALEALEAHQIGVLLDLNEERVDRVVDDAIPVDERGLAGTGILRYLCLERDEHTPGVAGRGRQQTDRAQREHVDPRPCEHPSLRIPGNHHPAVSRGHSSSWLSG